MSCDHRATDPEIQAVEVHVKARSQRVVLGDTIKKPKVVKAYNSDMNGVNVNDQYCSYCPSGAISCISWEYLLWFFITLSMVNASIFEKLARKKKRTQLDFCPELAKLLIARYNSYKRPSKTRKLALETVTNEKNLGGHFLCKLVGGKKACVSK